MKSLYRTVAFLCFVLFSSGLCLAQARDDTPAPPLQGLNGPHRRPSGAVKSEGPRAARESALRVLKGGPLRFEENAGQFDSRVKFASRGIAHTLFLTSEEAVLVVTRQKFGKKDLERSPGRGFAARLENLRQDVARLKLRGANPSPEIDGLDELPGRSHYLRGRDRSQWRTDVPNFARVRYRDVYPGVDWVHYGNEGRLEYDFVVSPGADPAEIAMDVSMDGSPNGNSARIDANGDLIVAEDPYGIRFHRPVAFQVIEGQKQLVSANYVLKSPGRVGFELGPYDRSQELVIDPVLTFSTYLGGSNNQSAWGVAVDATGVYVTGLTTSGDFPTTAGAVQETPGFGSPNCFFTIDPNPCFDAFVTKLMPDGSARVYSTFLGGSAFDGAFGIAVDGNGQAVVVGGTYSTDFPTSDGPPVTAFQTDINGGAPAGCQDSVGSTIDCEDAFVAVLNSTGTSLVYSTYVGGTGTDEANGAAVDASGNAYMTGWTDSDAASFPETAGAPGGGTCDDGISTFICADAFAGKFQYSPVAANPTASRVFLSYIGGNGDEFGNGIAVENSTGNVFVAGETSPNASGMNSFSVVNGFQGTHGGGFVDAFIAKLNSTGSTVLYSSFLGGGNNDRALDIGLDSTGKVFVGGYTSSSDFPVKNAFQATRDLSNCSGCLDSFVAKFNTGATGASSLEFSTYFGGSGDDAAFGLAVDPSGNVVIAGATSTPASGVAKTFPLMAPLQSTKAGGAGEYDGFVSKLNNTGNTLLFSTYIGGTGDRDLPLRVAAGPSDEVAVVGLTNSYDFPVTLSSYQPFHFGVGDDAFIVKIDTAANLPAAAFSDDILFFGSLGVGFTSMKTFTLHNMGTAALNISNVSLGGTDPSQFQFDNNCGNSVAAGSNCTMDVTFAPTTTGVKNALLAITDNASGSPHQVGLNGTGAAAPAVTLNPPATLTFPDTTVGTTSAPLQITVTNSGAANLNITTVTSNLAAFGVSGCANSTVPPGNNCVIDVTFSPTTGGVIMGSVTITDNAPGSPRTVTLTGTGIQPDFTMTTADDSETVTAGATATFTLTLTPMNGFNQQITFTCSGAPIRSTCQPPSAATLDGTNPTDVTLRVVTQARSAVPPGIGPFTTPPLKVPQSYLPLLLALLILSAASWRMAGGRRRIKVLLATALFTILLWTACGGGGGGGGTTPPPTGTPAGTYNITATATSGSLSKQIALTLVVQ